MASQTRAIATAALVLCLAWAATAVVVSPGQLRGTRLRDAPVVNDRPVVGILALPNSFPQYESMGRSYFAVRWLWWRRLHCPRVGRGRSALRAVPERQPWLTPGSKPSSCWWAGSGAAGLVC